MITKQDIERMKEACEVALQSDDTKCKVGAVWYTDDILQSTGYNEINTYWLVNKLGIDEDFDLKDDKPLYDLINACPKIKKKCVTHAEFDALDDVVYNIYREQDLLEFNENTFYVTKFPCFECAEFIVKAKVKRLVVPRMSTSSKWYKSQNKAFKYLLKHDVVVSWFDSIEMVNGFPTVSIPNDTLNIA